MLLIPLSPFVNVIALAQSLSKKHQNAQVIIKIKLYRKKIINRKTIIREKEKNVQGQ